MSSDQIVNIVLVATALTSVFIAIWSPIAAKQAAKYARQSVTTTVLLELHKEYSTEDMNDAVRYLYKLKEKHLAEYSNDLYGFARDYIGSTPTNSPEWNKRRMVSHFYTHLANLVYRGLIDKEAVFVFWGEQELAVIEILEPIETAIIERYYSLPKERAWLPLRLLHDAQQRSQSHHRWRKRIDKHFILPRNADLYARSLQSSKPSSEKIISAKTADRKKPAK